MYRDICACTLLQVCQSIPDCMPEWNLGVLPIHFSRSLNFLESLFMDLLFLFPFIFILYCYANILCPLVLIFCMEHYCHHHFVSQQWQEIMNVCVRACVRAGGRLHSYTVLAKHVQYICCSKEWVFYTFSTWNSLTNAFSQNLRNQSFWSAWEKRLISINEEPGFWNL